MRFAENSHLHMSKVLRLPRKMKMESPECCACHESLQLIFCEPFRSIAPVTQNDVRHVWRHRTMSRSPTLATQKHHFQILWNGHKKTVLQLSLLLRAAQTLQFAKNTQHDTSKVLRLPRKMTSEVSKPRKMQRIFCKCSKSIAPATQKRFLTHDAALTMRAENSHLHTSKVLRLPRKFATHLLRAFQKYCACHTKWRSTRFTDTGQCHEVLLLPQKNISTSFETDTKNQFCSFPYCFAQRRHCNSQKTRNTTRLKCCACHAKWHRRCPSHEKCNASFENVVKVLRLPHKNDFLHVTQPWQCAQKTHISTRLKCCACHESLQLIFCEPFKSIAPVTQNDVRHVLQTQDNVTKSYSCPKTPFPHPLKRTQKTSFAAFRGQNHSVKTRHVETEHFVRDFIHFSHFVPENQRFPTNFLMKRKICHVKINVSCEASVNFHLLSNNATPSTEFARFSPVDAALTMRLAQKSHLHTSKVLRLPRNMTSEVSKMLRLARKMIVWKCSKSIALATQNYFWHVMKHVGMSRSATPATRNEATQRWKAPKVIPFAELPIGTAIRPSRERLRTVADGCGRLRTVADVNATSGEHSSTPTPPEWNGNPCYAFGKNTTPI